MKKSIFIAMALVLGFAAQASAIVTYRVWKKPVSNFTLPQLPIPPGAQSPAPQIQKCDFGECSIRVGSYWNSKDPSGQQPFYYWSSYIDIARYKPTTDGVNSNLAFIEPNQDGKRTETMRWQYKDGAVKTIVNKQLPAPDPYRKGLSTPLWSREFNIKWDDSAESKYVEETQARVGNLVITVHYDFSGSQGARKNFRFPPSRQLVDQIVSQLEIASGVEYEPAKKKGEPVKEPEKEFRPDISAYPPPGVVVGSTCLVPASEKTPAKLAITGGKPGGTLEAYLPDNARGYLKIGGTKGKHVSGKLNQQGNGEIWYHYTPGKSPLKAGESYEVIVIAGGRKLIATVQVGLGIMPTHIRGLKGSTVRDAAQENTFVIAVGVGSAFRPDVNIVAYLENASQFWGGRTVGMKMVAKWLNDDGAKARDEFYNGITRITRLPNGTNILTAQKRPWYGIPEGKYFYPAIEMGEDGTHIYQISTRGAVINDQGAIDQLDEKTPQKELVLSFTKESPESTLTSLTCMFNATTDYQYMMLEAVKALPGFKQEVDLFLTTTSLVCGLLKGETEKSLIDLAAWTGGKVLERLEKPEVLARFSQREQKAIKNASNAYQKLDKEKKKREIKELHSAEGSWGIPPEVFDINLSSGSGEGSWDKKQSNVGQTPKSSLDQTESA